MIAAIMSTIHFHTTEISRLKGYLKPNALIITHKKTDWEKEIESKIQYHKSQNDRINEYLLERLAKGQLSKESKC
jgi:hypothetical protein